VLGDNDTLLRNSILTGALRHDASFFVNELTESFMKTFTSFDMAGVREMFNRFWSEMRDAFFHYTLVKTQFSLVIDIDDSAGNSCI
jgi:hypothetical protein